MKESQGKNTFSVEIRETRNQSWQGTLSCFDTEQELPFQKIMHSSSSEQPAASDWLLTWGFKRLPACLRQYQL